MSRGNVAPIMNSLLQPFFGSVVPTGTSWFIDSGAANAGDGPNKGLSKEQPLATIDALFDTGRVTANNGDVAHVMPGHVETLTAANTLAMDKAGVTLIFHGEGSDRPTITVATDVGATITVSAANIKFKGKLLVSNTIDNCTSMLTITGDDFSADDMETRDTGAVEAALVWTITGNRWHIGEKSYEHIGEGSGDQAVACFQVTGTDRGILENFNIDCAGSVAPWSSLSTANTLLKIRNGYFTQREGAVGVAVSLLAADTGFIGPFDIRLTDDNTDPFAAIDSGSNVQFVGPITVVAGDDNPGLDIVPGLAVEADQNLVETPWGTARVITELFTPAASLVPIFTPSVGKCLIVGLYCEITTECGAAADWKFQLTTTATGAVDYCAITQMDGEKVEGFWGITGRVLDLMLIGQNRCNVPFIVDGGASGITMGILGSEANVATGAATWTCLYIPLERGALITAAA